MKIAILLLVIALSGCSTTGDYTAYLAAQAEASKMQMNGQKPLVRITAQPGMSISGLAGIEVYTPLQQPAIQQSRPNEWASVVSQGLGIAGTVAGLKVQGDAAIGLATAVGKAGTHGYQYIQSPSSSNYSYSVSTSSVSTVGDNSGTNSSNRGKIAGEGISESSSTVSGVIPSNLPVE